MGGKCRRSGDCRGPGSTAARIANLMEEATDPELSVHSGRVKVLYHPLEIVSHRLNYPSSQAHAE